MNLLDKNNLYSFDSSNIVNTALYADNTDPVMGAPVPLWGIILVIIGVILLLGSFIPGFVSVVKSKNTADLSWVMWLVTVIGLFFLTVFYLMMIIQGASNNNGTPAVHAILAFLSEGISLILSAWILAYKLINMQKAKKQNISEAELCKRLVTRK